ncbi:hypothetical protein HYY75_06340 [bacterium]|nr:hypothetical protein [bacterium]
MNIPKIFENKRGSAILIALGLGVVLMLIVSSLHMFSSHRMQATTLETRHLMALGVAEAGLNLIQTELRNDYDFRTHSINPNLSWGAEANNSQTLKDEPTLGFSVDPKSSGTYSGKLGPNGYGTFKVRLGLIPYPDDPRTQNVDESQCFFRVESLGRIDDNSIRRTRLVQNRNSPIWS